MAAVYHGLDVATAQSEGPVVQPEASCVPTRQRYIVAIVIGVLLGLLALTLLAVVMIAPRGSTSKGTPAPVPLGTCFPLADFLIDLSLSRL